MRSVPEALLGQLGLSCVLSACTYQADFHTHVTPPSATERGIIVSGEGEVSAPPSRALIELGVESRHAVLEQATSDGNTRARAVVAALQRAGVAPSDLRTRDFTIEFDDEQDDEDDFYESRRPPPRPPTQGKPAGAPEPALRGHYVARHLIEITLHDVTRVNAVIALALDAGANTMTGVELEVADPDTMRARARILAIEDAKRKAADIAHASGVKLGNLVTLRDGDTGYRGAKFKGAVFQEARTEVAIQIGDVTIEHSVEVVYEVAR